MGCMDQLVGDVAVQFRQADIEPCAQEVGTVVDVQIDLGVDSETCRELDLSLRGGNLDRADVAGGPSSTEEVFGGRVRLCQLEFEHAVAALGAAVAAAGVVGLAGEKKLLGHGGILSG
ncbi:hypothetical protein D9M72_587680 [compost metagenome]